MGTEKVCRTCHYSLQVKGRYSGLELCCAKIGGLGDTIRPDAVAEYKRDGVWALMDDSAGEYSADFWVSDNFGCALWKEKEQTK
jgi:hypothetical protein